MRDWSFGFRRNIGRERSYHEEGPDGVVEEDDGGGHQHGETDELVELLEGGAVSFVLLSCSFVLRKKDCF